MPIPHPFALAQRYMGVHEIPGRSSHPLIEWWLSLCNPSASSDDPALNDDVPWCSAFVNGIAWEFGLPRSRSLAARSWLPVGAPVPLAHAEIGFDVVIFERGTGPQPDKSVIAAPGHVAWFGGMMPDLPGRGVSMIYALGGNQQNTVCVEAFPVDRILDIRRLV